MLCITRKIGEGVFMGRGIRVTVIGVERHNGSTVIRLGIEAPQNIAVSRDDFTLERHLEAQIKREHSE